MCQKKLNTHYGGRTSFALIQQQSSVPLTFRSIRTACQYVLMLISRPKDAPTSEHEASSLQFKASSFHSFGPRTPPAAAALYSLVEWKCTSAGSERCAAMGLLSWSIIYYGTRLSAEWQMPVRGMGPGRSELGYWPQHPRQTDRAYKDSLWWQVAVLFSCLSVTVNRHINGQITNLPQLH